MLKKPAIAGLWLRNIQLGVTATPLAAVTMLLSDGAFISQYGMLQGFGAVEWGIVLVNGAGGLLIAATMKYADSIVKCFANALAIISGTMFSVPIFGFRPSGLFGYGACMAIAASVIYSWAPGNEALKTACRVSGTPDTVHQVLSATSCLSRSPPLFAHYTMLTPPHPYLSRDVSTRRTLFPRQFTGATSDTHDDADEPHELTKLAGGDKEREN
jgi:hypothetical protein